MNFDLRWSKHPWFTAVPFLFSMAWARLGLHKSERPHWTSWFTISPMESPRSPMFHSFHQACSRWALCHAFCVLWHLWHGSKVKCFVFNEGRFFWGWGTNTHTKRCDILSFEHGISWKFMELHDVWGCMKPMRQTWNATWESGRSVRGWAIARCRPSRPNSDCTEPQTLWILRVNIPRHLQLLALIQEIKRYYIYVSMFIIFFLFL